MKREIVHQAEASKFEIRIEDQTAYIRYIPFEGGMDLVSTYVPAELEGQGIASALTHHVLEYARSHRLAIIPTCSFTVAYLQRHPEYKTLAVEK